MDTKTLTENITAKTGLDKEQTAELLEALCNVIAEKCSNMDSIAVPSFGTFEVKKRTERISTHPQSGKRMLIPPKLLLTFKPSAVLKKKIKEQ